jgi:hypothetical protein
VKPRPKTESHPSEKKSLNQFIQAVLGGFSKSELQAERERVALLYERLDAKRAAAAELGTVLRDDSTSR